MAISRTGSPRHVRTLKQRQIPGRRRPAGFDPHLFPSCDGRPLAAVPRQEPWLAAKRQFLKAYYEINVQYARLRSLRLPPARSTPARERAQLQAIDRALQIKEALEDRWAARGLVATPLLLRGITVNVAFAHPGRPTARPTQMDSSTTITLAFTQPRPVRPRA